MPLSKPACQRLVTWLRLNLGRHGFDLTGTDARALAAIAHVLELYANSRNPAVLVAFAACVRELQPANYELAYHAIAWTMEWDSRPAVWVAAGLPMLPRVRRCKGEG
jgi:hypothetical protein